MNRARELKLIPRSDRRAVRSGDNVVQFVDWLLGWFQTFLNFPLYLWQAWIFGKLNRDRPWLYFNYVYELEWVAIVGALVIIAPRHWIVATIALWRVAEILAWYVKLLFDKGHRVLLEVERNLLFLVIDLLIFVTLLALVLDHGSVVLSVAKWSDAFAAFTLNGRPTGYVQPWARIVGVLGAIGGLTLIGAGLAMLVGLIGNRIKYGPGTRYTGPTRPAPPWKSRY
jgi:hypothetical protein